MCILLFHLLSHPFLSFPAPSFDVHLSRGSPALAPPSLSRLHLKRLGDVKGQLKALDIDDKFSSDTIATTEKSKLPAPFKASYLKQFNRKKRAAELGLPGYEHVVVSSKKAVSRSSRAGPSPSKKQKIAAEKPPAAAPASNAASAMTPQLNKVASCSSSIPSSPSPAPSLSSSSSSSSSLPATIVLGQEHKSSTQSSTSSAAHAPALGVQQASPIVVPSAATGAATPTSAGPSNGALPLASSANASGNPASVVSTTGGDKARAQTPTVASSPLPVTTPAASVAGPSAGKTSAASQPVSQEKDQPNTG